MATVSRPAERYVEFDEYIDLQLDKTRNGIKWTDILAAAVGVAALVIGYLVVFVIADHWFFDSGVPQSLRIVAACVIALVAVLWVGMKVVWPYLRQVNELYAARMLEEAEPGLRGSLLGLVDLRRAGRQPADEVRLALEKRAATVLADVDVDSSVDRRELLRTSYALLAVVLIACVYAVASPKRIGPSIVRGLLPASSANVATRTEIVEVQPGNVTVLAGTQLDVSVMIRGQTPERVMLYYSTADRRFADEPVELRLHDETTREYRAALIGDAGRGLTQDLSYRVTANDDAAGPFAVTVDQPPVAAVKSVTLRYPPYTGLEPVVRDVPPIDAIEGTTVTLTATANRPLKAAKLVFADDERFLARGEEVPMQVAADGVTLTANWTLAIRSDGTSPTHYRIECRDRAGKTNPNPAVYPIAIRADLPPEVVLHDPKSDLERPANAIIPLQISARDPDFGLRELTLRLERQGQELPERTVLWEGTDSQAKVRYDWDLAPLGLKPGDVISFYIQARDNREPEFNRRNTPKLNVTITEPVAQEQIAQQLEQDKQRQDQELAAADRNAAATDDGESPPAGEDARPTPPEEAAGDEQPQPDGQPQAAEGGQGRTPENPTGSQGEGEAPPESKVDNNGDADDVALRKLLEHQRQQQNEPPQPDSEQQPPQDGEGQTGESKQGGESASQQNDAQGGKGEQQSGDGNQESADGASRQTPGGQSDQSGDQPQNSRSDAGGNRRPDNDGANQQSRGNSEQPGEQNGDSEAPGDQTASGQSSMKSEGRDGSDNASQQEQNGRSNDGANDATASDGTANDETGAPGMSENRDDDAATAGEKPSDETGGNAANDPMPSDRNGGMENKTEPGESTASDDPATGKEQGANPTDSLQTNGEQPAKTEGSPEQGQPSETGQPGKEETAPGEGMPSGQNGDPNSGEPNARKPASRSMSDQPPGTPQSQPGETDAEQRSPRSDSGETGTGQPNPSGTPSKQPGPSDAGTQPSESQPSSNASQNEPKAQPGESSTPSETMQDTGDQRAADQPPGATPSETGTDPQGSSESQTGESMSGEGQSSESQSGEGKSGEGKSGEGKSGEGKSGEGKSGEGKSGEGKSGEGKSGEGKAGEGKSGEGKSGEGKSGEGKSGEGQSGEGKASQNSGGGPPSRGGGMGTNDGAGGGNRVGNADAGPEQANADYARQATDLALNRLEDELERGEVDPELLKELGWTEEDMQRFADRLRKNLSQPAGDETPQQIADRKEFEHMLRNLNFGQGPAARTAPVGRVKDVGDVSTANPRVPTEYRDAYEAFTRSVAGRREAGEK